MKEYYFFNGTSDFFLGSINNIEAEKEIGINCIYERYTNVPHFLEKLNKLHTSIRINQKIRLPFKNIWKKYDEFNTLKDGDVIIVTDSSIGKIDIKDLKKWKHKNIHVYLLFLNTADTLAGKYALSLTKKYEFAKIFTVDKGDSAKYGFEYTNKVYNRKSDFFIPNATNGLFFVGRSKGRLDILYQIAEKVKSVLFFINDVPIDKQINYEGIVFNKTLPYKDVLNYSVNSECILEVIQNGQTGLTYRDYEAICYDKKLLTNNKEIFSLPEYDPRYIQYFEKVKDINLDFIDSKIEVNYRYNNNYSPQKLIYRIKEIENKYQ